MVIPAIHFSCHSIDRGEVSVPVKTNTVKPPITVTVRSPILTLLDTCPPPFNVIIPKKQRNSNVGFKTAKFLPPEIKPAGFFVPMQSYNTGEGLAINWVYCNCIDDKGNLWFGTAGGGVSRYDGKSFTNYTAAQGLASNNVFSILQDKSGNIWFGTLGGISCYNGRSFINYNRSDGLANESVFSVMEDRQGNLWFGTRDGLSKMKSSGKSTATGKAIFSNYSTDDGLPDNRVNCIFEDKNRNVWVGTSGGLARYDGRSFISYTGVGAPANKSINCIAEDKDGVLWVGTEKGIARLATESGFFRKDAITQKLATSNILSILKDDSGNLWFGTDKGASYYNGKFFIDYIVSNGLSNNRVMNIAEDKSGNLWFGTQDGVYRLDRDWKLWPDGKTALTSYTSEQGLTHNSVTSILEDSKGNFWFGTLGGGVSYYDKTSFISYTTAQGLANNMVRSIIEDRNRNIWFATDSGVSRLDQFHKCFTNYSTAQGLANNFVRCIIEDKSANIWFATYGGGVSCLDRQQKLFTTFTTEQGLAYNVVRNIAEDSKGNLWFCTLGGGVSMLNQDRKFFTNYTASQGLINNYVWNLFEDKNGNLWFSTETGISRFDRKSFSSYTSAESMGNNMVGDMVIDKTGVIWMGTNKGFTALKGFVKNEKQGSDTLHKHVIPASNKISNDEIRTLGFYPDFEIYNAKTGYPINDINLNGLFITHDDIIWAGTSDKLIRFDYSSLHKNPNPPNVFIQGLKVNNENVCWYDLAHDKQKIESLTIPPNITDEINLFGKPLSETEIDITRKKFKGVKFDSITRFYPLPVSLVLPYRHNNLTFDFAAIEPARPYLVRYEYMLEGYDKEWSPATDQTSAVFGNMYEGNYTFKLKAQSPDGVWSEPVAYTFRVLPPWYRTWWSFTLYALIFITALWRFIKWREKAIKKEAELKQQKTEFEMQALRAQMNPHFIFNSLNSISRYILKNQRVEANDYLTKFSKLIRMTLQHSAMPTIKLANEINMLQLYLELECLRFDKKITYEFQCDPHLDTELTEIPPLLLQPYVENAIWHGLMQKKEEGHLWIKMEQKEQYLVCTIADDGIGRNKTAELKPASTATHKSMGMSITANRIALLNQSKQLKSDVKIVDLISEDGSPEGTQVIINLPLIYD